MAEIFLPTKGALQEWTVRYNVSGALDGVTAAPSANDTPVEEGVHQVYVDGPLGIISPFLYGGLQSRADRFITFIHVDLDVPAPIGFTMSVADASMSGPQIILETRRITSPAVIGETLFITTECFTVPQGQALQIGPVPAPAAGSFHRITIGVRGAATGDDEARLARMCCCLTDPDAGAGGGGDGPAPPVEPGPSFDFYSFSSETLSVVDGDDTYARFSAAYNDNGEGETVNLSNALINSNEGFVGISAEKLPSRAGSLSRMVIRGSAPILYQWFVEIADDDGVFTRTYLMDAPVALVSNVSAIVDPNEAVAFAAGQLVRTGINVTSNAVLDLQIDIEVTTT